MKFAKLDRVEVVDLRTGAIHKGIVLRTIGTKVIVNYDDGAAVTVGESFVRHDNNPPEGREP